MVNGLRVTASSHSQIVVEPGHAIDCAGNEIYLASVSLAVNATAKPQYVVLRYVETLTNPVAGFLAPDDGASDSTVFTRVREGARLDVVDIDPLHVHDRLPASEFEVIYENLTPQAAGNFAVSR